jgi:hypothetical protein
MYHGSYYWNIAAQTDNDADTPIKVAGFTSGNDCSGFTADGDNRLRYDGATQRVFHFTCAFSASCSSATAAIFYLYKNGALISGSAIYRTIGAGAETGAQAITCLVRMNKGDYVELWCETDADVDNLTIESGTLVATVAG